MAYEKPKCEDCVEELILYEQFAYVLETKINKNGKRSKRHQQSTPLSHSGNEYLICNRCDTLWQYEFDNKGRIFKVM